MRKPFDYDLVCIGSGPAGQRAAVQAAKLGKRVAVLEYFLKTVFNYPTLAECYKVAAFNAANKLQYARSAALTVPGLAPPPGTVTS
jgi:succinate dehydrogenase/fumarate reductase flavoprotein subunit